MRGPRKGRDLWLKPIPPNVSTQKLVIKFQLDPADVPAKQPPVQVDDEMVVIYISEKSFWNGLILGDKVLKVNEIQGKKGIPKIFEGEAVSIELVRRKGQNALTKRPRYAVKKGHSMFLLDVERPPNMTATSVGIKLSLTKKRGLVLNVDTNTIGYSFFGRGDFIIEMDGAPVPDQGIGTGDTETFVREQLSKLSTGKKMTFLVERPIDKNVAREWQKFIESLCFDDSDSTFANDVIEIGREAANMHFLVFRKLQTPSILSSDVKNTKKRNNNNNKTSDATESTISISTASTEMKIKSDVAENEDLKPVTKKSHAVSNEGDGGGAFDDE